MTDGACAPGYEDRLALDRLVSEQAPMRGHGRHAQAGAKFGRDPVRQGHRPLGRNDRPLRGRAPPAARSGQVSPYSLADAAWVDALAHHVDRASTVVVRDL